jgi:hypothetical protein
MLAKLDSALRYLCNRKPIHTNTLHSIIGIIIWVFLLRRSLLCLIQVSFDIIRQYRDNDTTILLPAKLKYELINIRRVLPFVYGDVSRGVLPLVLAQDAEGVSESSLGGWGLGVSFPPTSEIVSVGMQCLSKSIPSHREL